jgi:hypothetical protein
MSNEHISTNDPDQLMIYQIRIKGLLDRKWIDWFGDVSITLDENGDTLLTCPVIDQAALHGMLKKVRDLGMPLLSVNRTNPIHKRNKLLVNEIYPYYYKRRTK